MNIQKATERLRKDVGETALVTTFVSDADDNVQSIAGTADFFGLPIPECLGVVFPEIVRKLIDLHGPMRPTQICNTTKYVDRCMMFHKADQTLWGIRSISVPNLNEFGMPSGSVTVAAGRAFHPEKLSYPLWKVHRNCSQWAPNARLFEFKLDYSGKLKEVPNDTEGLLGIQDKLKIGMTEQEFFLACQQTWGHTEYAYNETSPDHEDVIYRHDHKTDLYLRGRSPSPLSRTENMSVTPST